MDLPSRPVDRGGFHIAIICALTLESNAIDLLFDEIHDTGYGRAIGDNNTYTTGRVGNHAVVLLVLPNMGKEAAAAASAHLRSSFDNIKLALIVGICGGLPRIGDEEAFLGDVVISRSIVNYDFGRQYPDKFVVKRSVEDSLGRANKDIRGLLNSFDREHDLGALRLKAVANLNRLQAAAVAKRRKAKYNMPHNDTDKLFPPDYQHAHYNKKCDACAAYSMRFCEEASKLSCDVAGCDLSLHKPRQNRQQERPAELVPQIFIGRVASGNAVMKSGQHRDKIAEEHEIIAFEMEGAGAWDEVPCIVVKGICDYADSHKNKQWQNLAAATAASVAVGILAKYEVAGAATHNYHKGENNTTETEQLNVWLDNKRHSVEGHIYKCTLTFRNKVIWGPGTCHDNTVALRNAIHDADSRFDMSFTRKGKTVEGHTRYISVKSNGKVLLDKLSTHPNMAGLVAAINAALGTAS